MSPWFKWLNAFLAGGASACTAMIVAGTVIDAKFWILVVCGGIIGATGMGVNKAIDSQKGE